MNFINISSNTTNYTTSFNTPSVPTINVSIATITQSDMSSTASSYLENAQNYAKTYQKHVIQRDYNFDMIKKAICADSSIKLAKINLMNNTYTPNVKADNYFDIASEQYSLTTANGIINTLNRTKQLADQLYKLTAQDIEQLEENQIVFSSAAAEYTNSLYLKDITYDTRAIKVNVSAAGDDYSGYTEPLYFINQKPNATNGDFVLSAFTVVGDDDNQVTEKILTIRNNSTTTTPNWILTTVSNDTENESSIVKINENIDDIIISSANGNAQVSLTFSPVGSEQQ